MNHVERRPSAVRTLLPVTVTCDSSSEMSVSDATRPDGPVTRWMSAIGEASLSRFATVAASSRTGPQSWYGDAVSYGSATGTRYGTATPSDSAAEAVRPPDVEKKSVSATLPL